MWNLPKKSTIRDLQMPSPLISILEEHRTRHKTDNCYSPYFRVCGSPHCLRDTIIKIKNTEYAKSVGLPHIKTHDFRHSHASLLANEDINIQEISRRLGHSDDSMTWNTYSHLYPREEERTVAVLDKMK